MAFRDLLHTLDNSAPGPPDPGKCIVRHLNWLLNTRRDRHPYLPGYGMPDFHEYFNNQSPESLIALEIRKVIEKYEPRLSSIRVYPEVDDEVNFSTSMSVNFIIEAVLADQDEYIEFHETAEICREGSVSVK